MYRILARKADDNLFMWIASFRYKSDCDRFMKVISGDYVETKIVKDEII